MTIDLMRSIPFVSIFLMMLAGIATSPVKSGKWAYRICLAASGVVFCLSLALWIRLAANGEFFRYSMGEFPAPWGNELRAGPLEAMMATLFSLVTACSLLAGKKGLFEDILPEKQRIYYIMLDMLLGAMVALIYTNDIFTAYVFIEISTIAATALIMAKDTSRSLVAATRYLIMMLLGSGLYLFGIVILYAITGQLLMENIAQAIQNLVATGQYDEPLRVVAAMIFVGICIKSALFPFHTMLPGAHSVATPTSSAVLSALVLKAFIILLVKLIYRVFTIELLQRLGVFDVLMVFGALAMIVCSWMATRESDIKRMIAYSSTAQIGYIYLGISLAPLGGVTVACYHILAHALTKSMLFLSAGGLIGVAGHDTDIHKLRGTARSHPVAGAAFTLGAISMIGLPVLPGFVTKYALAMTASQNAFLLPIVVAVLLVSMVLNAAYYVPALFAIWSKGEGETKRVPMDMHFVLSTAVLAALVVLLGLCAQPMLDLIGRGLALL